MYVMVVQGMLRVHGRVLISTMIEDKELLKKVKLISACMRIYAHKT